MSPADVLSNAADQDKGARLELVLPTDGSPTGLVFYIVGPDSPTARRSRLQLADELTEAADASGHVGAEARETARINSLARLILRWEVSEDDKPVPFSTKAVLALLRVSWIEMQIDAFAADRRNFMGAA